MKHSQFTVQGVPFFSLGGQTYNSTSYVLADMPLAFESVRKLGGNNRGHPYLLARLPSLQRGNLTPSM